MDASRRKQHARSVSRLRSTLLLRRSASRNQRFITTVHEDESEFENSSCEESDDASIASGQEEFMSTPESCEPSAIHSTQELSFQAQTQARESDSTLSSKNSADNEPGTSKRKIDVDLFKGFDMEEESEKEEAVIDAVLAFQRWRQHNLKRSFSQELKKVLEEARRDEVSLTSMQRELMKKDVNLVKAQAETAQLRAHISAIENAVQSQNSSSYNEEARREVQKAQERAFAAEEEVLRRDREVIRLRQRLKCYESEKTRVDQNIQANIKQLELDNAGLRQENRAVLDQLARKDQALTQRIEEVNNLQGRIASMTEYHSHVKSEHQAAYGSLQERVKIAEDAKASVEKDVEALTSKCEMLSKEKEMLNSQLDKTLEKINSSVPSPDHAQCSSEAQSRTSEAIAAGILEHLRILTSHMIKLEASFGRHTRGPGLYNSLHRIDVNLELALKSFRRSSSKAGDISGKLYHHELQELSQPLDEDSPAKAHCALNQTVQTDGELSDFIGKEEEKYLCVRDAKTQTSGKRSQIQLYSQGTVQEVAQVVAWKWRWLSTALKAKHLAKQLRFSRPAANSKYQVPDGKSLLRNGYNSVLATMERELRAAMGPNIVPFFLSLWRTHRRCPRAERKALWKDLPFDKVLAVFPWWIRRVGEKRRIERWFCHWYYLTTCSARKQSSHPEDVYFHPHSCFARPSADEYPSVRRKVPKFKFQDYSSDGNPPQQGLVLRKKDADVERALDLVKPEKRQLMLTSTNYRGSTFTARALRTLQVSLQQEFQDLQNLLAQEMEASQVAVGHLDSEKSTQRRRMTYLWEVCNNLANALMDAHKQLVSLDREFNSRVSNYLELSANSNCEPKPSQTSPHTFKARAKSPTTSRTLRQIQIEEVHHPPVLTRLPDEYTAKLEKKTYPHSGVVLSTRKPSRSSRKKACIASQCAAILRSEARKYGQDKFDKGTMVQDEFVLLSPPFSVRRPPWTR